MILKSFTDKVLFPFNEQKKTLSKACTILNDYSLEYILMNILITRLKRAYKNTKKTRQDIK